MGSDFEAPLCLTLDAPLSLLDVEEGRGISDEPGGGWIRDGRGLTVDRVEERGRVLPGESFGGERGIEELL